MSVDIRFVTFNMGQGWKDYESMLSNDKPEVKKMKAVLNVEIETLNQKKGLDKRDRFPSTIEEVQKNLIARIEKIIAEKLARQADVIVLQEIVTLKRPFIKALKEQGFKLYTYDDSLPRFSTGIAIRKEQFKENIENRSIRSNSHRKDRIIYGQEITAIVVEPKHSNNKIAFSSLHSWGFQLYRDDKKIRSYSEIDRVYIKAGIEYLKEACDNLKDQTYVVIGGDINNNPQNQPKQFELMQERGFEILEPDGPTNINRIDSDYRDRTIDFIFVRQSKESSVSANATKVSLTKTAAKVLPGFDFTVEGNCADHKPVGTVLTFA